jgi:type VI secretion system secreted protein Hcp
MAYDCYLELEGIPGEATAKGFEKQIGVYSFSQGGSNPASVSPGTGGMSASRVSFSDLSIMKMCDTATPKLYEVMCLGTHIPKAKLTLRKATGSEQEGFLIITLSDVMVSSIQTSGSSGGDDKPTESVSFCFAVMNMEYKVQGKDGKLKQAGIFEWDQTKVSG